MQFRMIARRAPSGSVTVLGDLAQATGPWSYGEWAEVREILGRRVGRAAARRAHLGLPGARTGARLRFAPPPGCRARRDPDDVDPARTRPTPRSARVPSDQVAAASLAEAYAFMADHALIAVISPEELVPELARLARRHDEVGLLERDAMSRPVTIVPAPACKGLEFDAVVVVEPAVIAAEGPRGLRLLYVALTRPIQHLSVVHGRPLPAPLLD